MKNIITIIPDKIEFIFPTTIDKIAIFIIMLAVPSIIGVVWKAFDKNRNARGDAPNIFMMFMVVTLIYIFTYRSLSIQNEISIMEITPKKEYVIVDKKKYEEAIKEDGPMDFTKRLTYSNARWARKIYLSENQNLKFGYVTKQYLNEDKKNEGVDFKLWRIYYDIPKGNSFERRVVLDETLEGLKSLSDKITKEDMQTIYDKLRG